MVVTKPLCVFDIRTNRPANLPVGSVVTAHAESEVTDDLFFTTAHGIRSFFARSHFQHARFAVVLQDGPNENPAFRAGSTVLLDAFRDGHVTAWTGDGESIVLPADSIALLHSEPPRLMLRLPRGSGVRLLSSFPTIRLAVYRPWQRIAHYHWVRVDVAPGFTFAADRQLDLAVVCVITTSDARGKALVMRKVLLLLDNVDISLRQFQFRMPSVAMADMHKPRRADAATPSMSSLFSCRTVVSMTLRLNGVTTVDNRAVATLRSIGGPSPSLESMAFTAARSEPTRIALPFYTRFRATVSAQLADGVNVRQLEPFSIALTFAGSARVFDTISFDTTKLQLVQTEHAHGEHVSRVVWAQAFAGFRVQFDRDDGTQRTATHTLDNIVIPFLDVCSGEVTIRGNTFSVTHSLRVKLFPGRFARKTAMEFPCILGQPSFDARQSDDIVDESLKTSASLELDESESVTVKDDAVDDDANTVAPVVDDEETLSDDVEPTNVFGVKGSDEIQQRMVQMKRDVCAACAFGVTDGTLHRKNLSCAKYDQHQTQVAEYERLKQLLTHVSVRLAGNGTAAFTVEMAPSASYSALVQRVEEVQGRKVRRLTLNGSDLPSTTSMTALIGEELRVELTLAKALTRCRQCDGENGTAESKCTSCGGTLLPPRLARELSDKQMELPMCVICSRVYVPGSTASYLACTHGFHARCLAGWLAANDECPVCDSKVSKKEKSTTTTK